MRSPALIAPLSVLAALLAGCTAAPLTPTEAVREQRDRISAVREELAQVPLPTKTRYMAVRSLSQWENPYLTVQDNMVTLHVTVADANPSTLGQGGMLRPVGARRQELNVRTTDLAAALNAVPENAWPYGRVVALEEAHNAPKNALPALRRNMEAAIKTLNDLGVVVYEWQDGGAGLR